MAGLGALVTYIPQVEEFLNRGLPVLEKIGYAIGSFFGNVIGGFTSGATSGLVDIANNLSVFMTNLQPFMSGVQNIPDGIADNIGNLVKAILMIVGADVVESISSFITGSSSLADFGTQLTAFGTSLSAFSMVAKTIDESAVQGVANAGKLLAELQEAIPKSGGLAQFFTGEHDMQAFSEGIGSFAEAIKGASDRIGTDGINTEAFNSMIIVGNKLSELQASLENTGGVIQWFSGRQDLGNFGENIKNYAEGLKEATTSLGKESINPDDFNNAIMVGEKMNELQASLPKDTEGFFSTDMNLSSFATNIQNFATGLTQFSGQVTNIDTEQINVIITAAKQMVALISQLSGDDALSSAVDVSGMKTVGAGLSDFYNQVSGIDSGKLSSLVGDTEALKSMVANLSDFDSSGISNFNIEELGSKLSSYAGSVAGIDAGAIASSVNVIQQLISTINSMKSVDASGVSQFTSALSSLGSANLSGVTDAFKGSASQFSAVGSDMINSLTSGLKSSSGSASSAATSVVSGMLQSITGKASAFNSAGIAVMTNLIGGVTSQSGGVANAAALCMSAAISQVNGWYGSFASSGSYVASGFVNGISSQISAAASAAASMAAAASAAARANLKIASPSKVFYQIGSFVGQGFVNALRASEVDSYKAGEGMADSARSGLSAAVSKIGRVIDGVADLQPTIKPVLDLSSVRSGVGTLNGMLGSGNSMSIMANLSAINTSMNRRRQNGSNADVIAAINKLGKSIGSMPRNTTTINGITYDNGSAVNEAVETLVRAVRIEGRK